MIVDQKQTVRELLLQYELKRKEKLTPLWTEMGLIAGQPRVLNKLLERDNVTQKELSDSCNMDPATLSRLLDRLETMGYVSRMDHPNCRRSYQIALTDSGREKAVRVHQVFMELETEMLQGFSGQEIGAFSGMMERICNNIQQG